MNFLYKESMCNGTNKGPKSGRLRSRVERKRKKEGRSGKESERDKRARKGNLKMTTVLSCPFVYRAITGHKCLGHCPTSTGCMTVWPF